MSRIGKMPVIIPEKVNVKLEGILLNVKGPKGELSYEVSSKVIVKIEGNEVKVLPQNGSKNVKAMWGTARTLINNMIKGVSIGFKKSLEFNGIGYKAQVKGASLVLNLGYSHPIDYKLPSGISVTVVKNVIDVAGIDKELVGFAAAKIRSFRPPEPYKGKGVKYVDEVIIRKAGKSGGK